MSIEFLSTSQTTSDTIFEGGSPSAGDIIVAFFGTMADDEKWSIEIADASKSGATKTWVAVHATDFIDAEATVGTPVSTSAAPVNLWQGPRADNRVFEVPTSVGFEYRARLVYKSGSSSPTTNGNVTACFEEKTIKDYAFR